MLRIGEFSKLSHITVKALRFYEKEGLLRPAAVDHSLLNAKKELISYGYKVGKISLKQQTITFIKEYQ